MQIYDIRYWDPIERMHFTAERVLCFHINFTEARAHLNQYLINTI